jgi:hypothetical protein
LGSLALMSGVLPGFSFVDAAGQRRALARYLPEARCQDAGFSIVEEERGIRGDGFTTLSIRSDACVDSIRTALQRRGSRHVYLAEGHSGLGIPGTDRLVGNPSITFHGPELNLFTFREDGSALWERYSE